MRKKGLKNLLFNEEFVKQKAEKLPRDYMEGIEMTVFTNIHH